MPKYGVISGPYFPVFGLNTEIYIFSPNTGKYGPGITPYLDTFHAVVSDTNLLDDDVVINKIVQHHSGHTSIIKIREKLGNFPNIGKFQFNSVTTHEKTT